jgi:hypothetical protein
MIWHLTHPLARGPSEALYIIEDIFFRSLLLSRLLLLLVVLALDNA